MFHVLPGFPVRRIVSLVPEEGFTDSVAFIDPTSARENNDYAAIPDFDTPSEGTNGFQTMFKTLVSCEVVRVRLPRGD
jgi:hypothetical protein